MREWHRAPVECRHYTVLEAFMAVNTNFDPQKPLELVMSDLEITHRLDQAPDKPNEGFVQVHVAMKQDEKKNVPYRVKVHLAGNFEIDESFPAEKKEMFLKTNGASILFGVARELVRDLTSRGPHNQILLPTISFAEVGRKTKQEETKKQTAKP
jgi:preprotein translocase subunit SecB